MPGANLDPDEVSHFGGHAAGWWDPRGPLRTLHAINPVRLRYIESCTGVLEGRYALDVGCGGGLLSEAMARRGAHVTGIDASPALIEVARSHLAQSGLEIEYIAGTAEQLAQPEPRRFDIVTCMELLEHVPDPPRLLRTCAGLLRPGGSLVVSTLNRTLKAYAAAVLGAEYLLRLLPRGTHDYARFIRPSELRGWLAACGMDIRDISGIRYIPWLDHCSLSEDVSVNYMIHARHGD